MRTEPRIGDMRYDICCWDNRDGRWGVVLKPKRYVRFKSSKRLGWKSLTPWVDVEHPPGGFTTREAALAAGQARRARILSFGKSSNAA